MTIDKGREPGEKSGNESYKKRQGELKQKDFTCMGSKKEHDLKGPWGFNKCRIIWIGTE